MPSEKKQTNIRLSDGARRNLESLAKHLSKKPDYAALGRPITFVEVIEVALTRLCETEGLSKPRNGSR